MVGNVPAVNMEEVVPLATSQSTLLAPEEIKVSSVCVCQFSLLIYIYTCTCAH